MNQLTPDKTSKKVISSNGQPLAHSARKGIAAQTYKVHVERVTQIAVDNAERAAKYLRGDRDFFIESVRAAALNHDLGKLDDENQRVLKSSSRDKLPVYHEDAGTARLLESKRLESALLAFSHHRGLPSIAQEGKDGQDLFLRDRRVVTRTNGRLNEYRTQHDKIIGHPVSGLPALKGVWSGLTRRIALSCLVDADHTDTAENYGNEKPYEPPELKAKERLKALDAYVEGLASDTERDLERNKVREQIYFACRNATINAGMLACDSPVGTGKTTAIMAHLLRAAEAKGLRRLFVVLPYTNIIKQSVDVYRKALTLPEEMNEEVIAAHHHQADFSSRELRHLAQLWNSPVIVTTAVQFFETLGSHHPSRLRKLHELAGSAILIDESHAAIPAWLWAQMLLWLRELVNDWGCHIVFASGSLVRFWELEDFSQPALPLPELVSEEIRTTSLSFESKRVTYKTHKGLLNVKSLTDFVLEKPGPRLLILNTVQSAAVVANAIKEKRGSKAVYHLSTALCPADRDIIVKGVIQRLQNKQEQNQQDKDWTLVATSCVEAGMDFSFRTAFRESCGLVNLIQIGGRISRSGEYEAAEVWDFRVLDTWLTLHPSFETSRVILDEMFEENKVDALFATESLRREVRRESVKKESDELRSKERRMDYPEVSKLCRVINSDTRTVIVDLSVIADLENRQPVTRADIMKRSVQIWAKKLDHLPIKPIRGTDELWAWTGKYDSDFLGYMSGVLEIGESSAYII